MKLVKVENCPFSPDLFVIFTVKRRFRPQERFRTTKNGPHEWYHVPNMKRAGLLLWDRLNRMMNDWKSSTTCDCGEIYDDKQYPKCPECNNMRTEWSKVKV